MALRQHRVDPVEARFVRAPQAGRRNGQLETVLLSRGDALGRSRRDRAIHWPGTEAECHRLACHAACHRTHAQALALYVRVHAEPLQPARTSGAELHPPEQPRPVASPIIRQAQPSVLFVDAHDQQAVLAGVQLVGYVKTEGHKRRGVSANALAVQPYLAGGMYSTEVEPDPASGPFVWQAERSGVPARARVCGPEHACVYSEIPDLVRPFVTEPLALPTAWHLDGLSQQLRLVEPSTSAAFVVWIEPEPPLSVEAHHALAGMAKHGIDSHGSALRGTWAPVHLHYIRIHGANSLPESQSGPQLSHVAAVAIERGRALNDGCLSHLSIAPHFQFARLKLTQQTSRGRVHWRRPLCAQAEPGLAFGGRDVGPWSPRL